jgi:hypothetical protein
MLASNANCILIYSQGSKQATVTLHSTQWIRHATSCALLLTLVSHSASPHSHRRWPAAVPPRRTACSALPLQASAYLFARSVSVFFSFVHTNNNKIETNNVYQRPFGPFLQRSVDPRSIADPRCLMMCGAGFCRGGPCLTNECATTKQDRIKTRSFTHVSLPLRSLKAVELESALDCAGLLRYLPYGT